MNYRERRAEACAKLFQGFEPNLSKSRNPERVRAVAALASQGLHSEEIAARLGTTAKAVQKLYRKYGFPTLQNFCPPVLEERQGWAGGIKEVKGYLYKKSPGHPHASKHGSYVAVHRLVVEKRLGRYLEPTEVVDHIDRNTKNNHPDNLRVFASNAEHLRVTLSGRCPNWSEAGIAALARARNKPRRTRKGLDTQPNRVESGTDADR